MKSQSLMYPHKVEPHEECLIGDEEPSNPPRWPVAFALALVLWALIGFGLWMVMG